MVKGTTSNDIMILTPFSIIEPNMFFLSWTDLVSPLKYLPIDKDMIVNVQALLDKMFDYGIME